MLSSPDQIGWEENESRVVNIPKQKQKEGKKYLSSVQINSIRAHVAFAELLPRSLARSLFFFNSVFFISFRARSEHTTIYTWCSLLIIVVLRERLGKDFTVIRCIYPSRTCCVCWEGGRLSGREEDCVKKLIYIKFIIYVCSCADTFYNLPYESLSASRIHFRLYT